MQAFCIIYTVQFKGPILCKYQRMLTIICGSIWLNSQEIREVHPELLLFAPLIRKCVLRHTILEISLL